MSQASPSRLLDGPFVTLLAQADSNAGESMIESVPESGDLARPLTAAEENAVLIIALPVMLLVVGAVLHLVQRRGSGSDGGAGSSQHSGGVILMGIGGGLTFAILAYLLILQ